MGSRDLAPEGGSRAASSDPAAAVEHSARVSKPRWLWAWALACVLLTAAAFFLGRVVRSPWDDAVANSTAEPVVTAEVAEHEFDPVVPEARGAVSLGELVDVIPLTSEGRRLVVTGSGLSAGSVVRPGQVLAEVSGRPIIGLDLPFALYRDLRPGDEGPDVTALQDALRRLGHYAGRSDGHYGAATSAAVDRLYDALGVSSPAPSPEAQSSLTAARNALREAETAIGDSALNTTSPNVSELRRIVDTAAVEAGTPLPMAEIQVVRAEGAEVVSLLGVGAELTPDTPSVATLRIGIPSVKARVSVQDSESFTMGAQVEVSSVSDATPAMSGVVSAVSDFQPAGGDGEVPGFDLEVSLTDPTELPFQEGQGVTIRPLHAAAPVVGLAVPLVAVREAGGEQYVLLMKENSATKVVVEIAETGDGYARVTSGLEEGARVLVSGSVGE